jgi:thiol-disulfide isomerase/thioredoxin
VRAPPQPIYAPPFPPKMAWVNVASLRMDQQAGRPVLIEFWDFCRPNSLHTLPYLKAWHSRYEPSGLRVIGVHASGFPPSGDPDAVRAAVERLGIEYAVAIDAELELWRDYDNLGWPARYLFDQRGVLFEYHYGECAYAETEQAICELLGADFDPVPPLRPEDVPDALLVPQTEDVAGPYSGPYEAGEVWAVCDGVGSVVANGCSVEVEGPGAYQLLAHPHSVAGVLELAVDDTVACFATCFAAGLAP